MVSRLSFSVPVCETILNNAEILLPGLDKLICIYYCPDKQNLLAYVKEKDQKKQELELAGVQHELVAERNNTNSISWTSEDNLFISLNRKKSAQLLIKDELKNHILILRIPNYSDGKNDIIIFYLREDYGLFGLSKSDTVLTADNKSIIGRIMYNSIIMLQALQKDDLSIYNHIRESLNQSLQNNRNLERKLKAKSLNYSQSIIRYSQYFLEKLSETDDFSFALSDSAIAKLSTYENDFEHLEKIITAAATIALNRGFYQPDGVLEIVDNDLIFHTYEKKMPQAHVSEIPDRYAKTKQFLDKYEAAVRETLNKQLPINGQNVGKNCIPPVSPAAITDSLKNHRKSILTLFDRYPDKWPLIRNKFRPVMNVISAKNRNMDLLAG